MVTKFIKDEVESSKTFKKLYGPFLWMGFNCLKARATTRRQFTFIDDADVDDDVDMLVMEMINSLDSN